MNVETTRQILIGARELVARPGGWTQGVFARNRDGEKVCLSQKEAVCFCASGAISRAAQEQMGGSPEEGENSANALELLFLCIPGPSIPDWNDSPGRTQGEVVSAFDRIIGLLS